MTVVAEILKSKPDAVVHRIAPTDTVYEGLRLMADKGIGALLVMEGDAIVGIVTERDYARKIALKGLASGSTLLTDVMTPKLYVVSPRQTVQECMGIMNQAKIRHLPVVVDGAVVGLVSIGDLVNATMAEQEFLISQLGLYISGGMR